MQLVVGIDPAGGHGAEVEGGTAEPADVAHLGKQQGGGGTLRPPVLGAVPEAGGDQGLLQRRGRLARNRTGSGRAGELSRAPPPDDAVNSSPVAALSTTPARTTPPTSAAIDTA